MKILLLTDYCFPQINGIATRIENIIHYLRKRHNVVVYGPNYPSVTKYMWSIPNPWNKGNDICIPGLQLVWDLIFDDYDVIHVVSPPALYSYPAYLIGYIRNKKIVTSNHCYLMFFKDCYVKYEILKKVYLFLLKYFIYYPQILFSTHIIAPTKSKDLERLLNYETKKMETGVNTELFSYSNSPRKKELLYAGRIAEEKGLYRTLDLYEKIKDRYSLKIIGNGPILDDLKRYAENKLLNVEFLGNLDHNELPQHYQSAFAFISTSLFETYGFTLLECLACGTPILYPKCDVFCNLYDDKFKPLSFDIDDDDEFIKSLENLENNYSEYQSKCKIYNEMYGWDKAIDNLVDSYYKN